jgi:hypothetical protein
MAFVVRNTLLALVSALSHAAQIPLDIATVATETAKGIVNFQFPERRPLKDVLHDATFFDPNKNHSSASNSFATVELAENGGKVANNILKAIDLERNSHARTHASAAASTTGGATGAVTAVPPLATASLTDTVGHASKELSGTEHFSKKESQSNAERNVYLASAGTMQATRQNDSHDSRVKTHALLEAVSDIDPARKLLSNQGVSGPLLTALLRSVALALPLLSSVVLNKATIATVDGRIKKALVDATNQGASAGADRINSLHSNLSSLSNIMRLCAENLGGSPAIRTTAETGEVVSSRALSMLMTNVSDLADALRKLVIPEDHPRIYIKNSATASVDATERSAQPDVMAKLDGTIKEVLDRIEQANADANGHEIIPHLNRDMASQISSTASSGASTLQTTHSLVMNPTILAVKAADQVRHTEERQRDEALMNSLPELTKALNGIQACTINMMAEMQKAMLSRQSSIDKNSLLSSDLFLKCDTAITYWAVSALSLICDELLTICRSFTLIDQERMKGALKKASEVESKPETAQASEQMAWDSRVDEPYSATHATTALRLTLSHTGIALLQIANNLHKALEDQSDTQKRNLKMHTLQQTLLVSTSAAVRSLTEGALFTAGGVSAFPVTFIGSADSTHKSMHSTDKHLHPAQTHSCENASSGISKATGFSTDVVGGTITNILKVLSQAGLIGMDTVVELLNIVEIISLHRDSHKDLLLETKASANPNGLFKNTVVQPGVGSSAGISALLINLLGALQTADISSSTADLQRKLKKWIDAHIEQIAMLKDDEETNNRLGLKAFYRAIISLLQPRAALDDVNDLVKRLAFGGIYSASYHSDFGAYDDSIRTVTSLAHRFENADDAHDVLREFIDAAKNDWSLLKRLTEMLPENLRSKKAQLLYDQVFEETFQHYKQVKINDAMRHRDDRKKSPTEEHFKIDIGLIGQASVVTQTATSNNNNQEAPSAAPVAEPHASNAPQARRNSLRG